MTSGSGKMPVRRCFRQKNQALHPVPAEQNGCWQRMFYRIFRAWHGFWNDDCIDRAGLLAYTTLFGLIPLAVLGFSLWNGHDSILQSVFKMYCTSLYNH